MDDNEIVTLYEEWSERFWAAGFMDPSKGMVRQFRDWLGDREPRQRLDYENEMLAEYHRQETSR